VFYLTTAIDYVNSLPHIGTAYEKIGADILARFHRLRGEPVLFQMGNDEHSANVQKAALQANLEPKVYCDQMREKFHAIWSKLGISYDQFIQTSDPRHHKVVHEFFERVQQAGDIYEKDYEGWYCESCEAFYTEKDLENGLCQNHKTKPKWLKEKNYFFRLEKYTQALLNHIEKNPSFILPEKRRNEVVNFIKNGLQDFSISRSTFTWGIPVPVNPKHVFYVWFDALINYLSLLNLKSLDELEKNSAWNQVMHIVGKDITRFHCMIWPAMLLSAKLPLPKTVFGHGFVYLRGEKMSKSLGNVVTPLDVADHYGADALRYYLMRSNSFGDDGNFTWDDFILRYNGDLANGLGNLVSRTIGMIDRYFGGKLPALKLSGADAALAGKFSECLEKMTRFLDPIQSGDLYFNRALDTVWEWIGELDRYIDHEAPWTLAKEQKTQRLSEVLVTVVRSLASLTLLLKPFIPDTSSKMWKALGLASWMDWDKTNFQSILPEIMEFQVFKGEGLFPRIEKK